EGHVLRVGGAGGVVVAADAADAAGDEVRVARILALQEHAEAAEDRRRALALGHPPGLEVQLGVEAQAAHDPGDRIPVHLHEAHRTTPAGPRQSGSFSSEERVNMRSARTVRPYMSTAAEDILAPGGSSWNGMNLSGKPGMVQPMHTPPTLG